MYVSLSNSHCLLSIIPRPPISTLFPYTTLFRSRRPNPRREICNRSRECFWMRRQFQLPWRRHRKHLPLRSDTSRSSRSEEHTSELQSHSDLVCRLLLEKKKRNN